MEQKRHVPEGIKYGWKEAKKWLFQNRWILLLTAAVVFMAHGSILFSRRFGIDTDAIMLGMHNFMDIGRQGLVWLAGLLELDWFNLYFAQVLTLLFMLLSAVAFGGLFCHAGGAGRGERAALFAFALAYVISPYWTAQIYFLNQSAQVLLACALTAGSIALAEAARRDLRRRWGLLIGAVLLMQITFSCYQVLVLIYVMGAVMVFLLSSLREERTLKQSLQWIAFHGISFGAGLGFYLVISRLFFMGQGSYLAGQIAWKEAGFWGGLRNCYSVIKQSLRETAPFYTGWYVFFVFCFLVMLIFWLLGEKERGKGSRILILLSALFLAASPYGFVFLYGGEVIDRMRLAMPFGQGCILYLTILLFARRKAGKKGFFRAAGVWVFGVVLGAVVYKDSMTNLSYCTRLYYTDEYVFQYASRVAADLYEDIRTVQCSQEIQAFRETSRDNIVMLGYPAIPLNSICISGHTIGRSIFEVEALAGNTLTRDRSRYFMRNLGYPVDVSFTEGETAAFHSYFDECFGQEVDAMPCYPDPGYIKCVQDEETGMEFVVVKLGQDWRLPEWKRGEG